MCMITYRRLYYDNLSIYLVFFALFEISHARVTCIFVINYYYQENTPSENFEKYFFMIYNFLCHLVYNGMNIYEYTLIYSMFIYLYKF